jgi:hypothetical protein
MNMKKSKKKVEIIEELHEAIDAMDIESDPEPGLLFYSNLLQRLRFIIETGCGWRDKIDNETP